MTRKEIETKVLSIFREQFEIEDPAFNDDLKETYEFDSIDAIELLIEIEEMLGISIDQEVKKDALLQIRTINHICDYIESVQQQNRCRLIA